MPLLLVLVVLFAVGLAVLKAFVPGADVIAWSWIAYGIGGIIIFLVLSRRRRQKTPHSPEAGKDEEEIHTSGGPISLDEVRDRIRQRKREKEREERK